MEKKKTKKEETTVIICIVLSDGDRLFYCSKLMPDKGDVVVYKDDEKEIFGHVKQRLFRSEYAVILCDEAPDLGKLHDVVKALWY